jgi:hypothetical protein
MASMGFDKETVVALMSLVDEQKDKLNEAEYVKMCNAIRDMHRRVDIQPTSSVGPGPTPPLSYTEIQWAMMRVDDARIRLGLVKCREENDRVIRQHRVALNMARTRLEVLRRVGQ